MSVAVLALVQVALIVLLGYIIRRFMGLQDAFWGQLAKLTYYLFTPALLISSLGNKPLQGVPWLGIAITLIAVLLVSSLLLILWQLFIRPVDPASFTSVFQGGVRFNSFVALAIVYNLFGEVGLVTAAISMAVIVITVNILCLLVFSFCNKALGNWKSLLINLILNPLILGCVIGLGINLSPITLPNMVNSTLSMLGRCALPLALLTIGAALKPQQSKTAHEMVIVSSVVQLLIKPILSLTIANYTGLEGTALVVVVIMMSVPTAPSGYVLAKQLGGNALAMASIITSQTFLALLTLPLILHFLMSQV